MREIELKYRVDSFDIKERAAALGIVWAEAIRQDDSVYIRPSENGNPERIIFRIRIQNDKATLTLKQDRTSELDCLELESLVQDSEAVMGMLELLGFEKTVQVVKTRTPGKDDKFDYCLDEVEDLGVFFEIESLVENDVAGDTVTTNLQQRAAELGLREEDRVTVGYDTLIRQQQLP